MHDVILGKFEQFMTTVCLNSCTFSINTFTFCIFAKLDLTPPDSNTNVFRLLLTLVIIFIWSIAALMSLRLETENESPTKLHIADDSTHTTAHCFSSVGNFKPAIASLLSSKRQLPEP